MNGSYNAIQVPSDRKSICQYITGLTLAFLWSIGWCILDTHNEWQTFPTTEFCLSHQYEISFKRSILFLIWDLPLDVLLIDCVRLCWKLYNLPNDNQNQSPEIQNNANNNFKNLSINSIILSTALLAVLVALYPAFIVFDFDSFAISANFLLLSADLLKIPIQLMFTFQDNSNTQRQTRATRRQAIMVQEVEERLNDDDQGDFFELKELHIRGEERIWIHPYSGCFEEPQRRSNRLAVPEDTYSDLNLAIHCPPNDIPFIDEEVVSLM